MEGIIKKRSLNLAQPLTPLQEKDVMKTFSEMRGVLKFEVTDSSGLRITYDLMNVNLLSIEKMLNEMNYWFSKGLLQRFKKGWISYMEENEYANMKTIPHSCCQDPKNN